MRTRHAAVFLVVAATLLAAACGSSDSDSAGAMKAGGGGPSGHEQPPGDEQTGDIASLGEPSGGGGGKGGMGGMGGNSSGGAGGTGNAGAVQDAGAGPPANCMGWQTSTARLEVGDTNDTMSAVRAREALNLGFAPAPTLIRPRDFFNYYDIDLPGGDAAQALTVAMQLRERAVPGQYDLFVGVQAPKAPRPRSVLTILVDTTPSMAGIALGRAQLVLRALGGALSPTDSVAVLTTDDSQGTLEPQLSNPAQAMDTAANWLEVSSSGDIEVATKAAYGLAQKRLDPAAQNRVIFISDGAEPPERLPTDVISAGVDAGIRLVGVGTGPTPSYRDRLLGKASHYGRGAYVYVDNEAEAKRSFQERFDKTFGVSFDDVRIELSLPFFYRQVTEPTSTASAAADLPMPQSLAPGATLAGVMRLEVCDPSVFSTNASQIILATVRWLDPVTHVESSLPGTLPAAPVADLQLPELDKGLAIRSYVQALQSVDKQRVIAALTAVSAAQAAADTTDPDLTEIQGLLEVHPAKNLP